MRVKWPYVMGDLCSIALLGLVLGLGLAGEVPWWLSVGYLLYVTKFEIAFKFPFAKGDSVREMRRKFQEHQGTYVGQLLGQTSVLTPPTGKRWN